MTLKHRRIHLFLQLFFLTTGVYEGWKALHFIFQPDLMDNLFRASSTQLPIIVLASHIIAVVLCFTSGISLWSRAVWSYGMALFTSGYLLTLNLFSLSEAIQNNSFHIIPAVLILLVLMQSFPFLLRRSYRGA